MDKRLSTETNVVTEVNFVSEKPYDSPFMEVNLDEEFTAPDGSKKLVPAFWAGGSEWRMRYASPVTGTHSYRGLCSDADDAGLHGVEGAVEVTPYTDHPLYRHGPIGISEDQRHFEHADGTPFFWLGDTWWKGLCNRIPWEGFQKLTADRKAKGYTVVQMIGGGPYPDEPPFDPL
jgi:hypothetical protein